MKKLCMVLALGILVCLPLFGLTVGSTVKQSGLAPVNGQLVDDDGNIVNQVNSVSKLQFTHDFASEDLNWTSTWGFTCRVVEIEIHFAQPVTGNIVISKKYADGTTAIIRKIAALTNNQDLVFNDVIFLDKGSQLSIKCSGPTPVTTAVIGISYSKLVF